MSACGTVAAYRKGCRCEPCRAAKAANRRRLEQHQADRTAASPPAPNVTETGYTVHATCRSCGGDLEHEASGRPTGAGSEVRATARCMRNGCRKRWIFVVAMYPFHPEEVAA